MVEAGSISWVVKKLFRRVIGFADCLPCLLYTSDAADDMQCVYLGCRRIIKKKKYFFFSIFLFFFFFFFFFFSSRRRHIFFFKQKTAYEMLRSLVGSEMCIRDRRKDLLIDGRGRFNLMGSKKAIQASDRVRRLLALSLIHI